jgi:hypothetical protein
VILPNRGCLLLYRCVKMFQIHSCSPVCFGIDSAFYAEWAETKASSAAAGTLTDRPMRTHANSPLAHIWYTLAAETDSLSAVTAIVRSAFSVVSMESFCCLSFISGLFSYTQLSSSILFLWSSVGGFGCHEKPVFIGWKRV